MDKDQPPKVYIVAPTILEEQIKSYVAELTDLLKGKATVIYANAEEDEGSRISETYDIEEASLPAVLICLDDDSVYKDWYGQDLPAAEMIAYELGQIAD